MVSDNIKVSVAYAGLEQQTVLEFVVTDDCSVQQAIEQSGILQQFPEINLATQRVGIFSRLVDLTDRLQPGDRIEIYRPLMIDPKDARRVRADQ